MEEFASVSGISRPTVSKYFNDPGSVRKSTRAKIEAALEKYEYRPNIYAINQNRAQTKNIGIVVPLLTDPFFAELARNIERLVIASGYRPILLSSHGSQALEIERMETLRAIKPAGVLMAPLGRASDRDAVAAFAHDVPTVLFDSQMSRVGEAFVGHDIQQSTDLLCEYLTRTGAPPVFFEMELPTNPNARRRRQAYADAMARLGHSAEYVQVPGDGWDFEEIGHREGLRVLSQGGLATNTVLCSNDRLAIGFLAAAYEKGMRVGAGSGTALRVAGHDDHPFSRFTCPTLTTVAQDYAAIAERSVDILMRIVESGERPANREEKFCDGRLILRASA